MTAEEERVKDFVDGYPGPEESPVSGEDTSPDDDYEPELPTTGDDIVDKIRLLIHLHPDEFILEVSEIEDIINNSIVGKHVLLKRTREKLGID